TVLYPMFYAHIACHGYTSGSFISAMFYGSGQRSTPGFDVVRLRDLRNGRSFGRTRARPPNSHGGRPTCRTNRLRHTLRSGDGMTAGAGLGLLPAMAMRIAAISEPAAISKATCDSAAPAAKRKPATIGPIAEPPRPTPIAKPVPPARTSVGNICAN